MDDSPRSIASMRQVPAWRYITRSVIRACTVGHAVRAAQLYRIPSNNITLPSRQARAGRKRMEAGFKLYGAGMLSRAEAVSASDHWRKLGRSSAFLCSSQETKFKGFSRPRRGQRGSRAIARRKKKRSGSVPPSRPMRPPFWQHKSSTIAKMPGLTLRGGEHETPSAQRWPRGPVPRGSCCRLNLLIRRPNPRHAGTGAALTATPRPES